jgi:hypothetical protein
MVQCGHRRGGLRLVDRLGGSVAVDFRLQKQDESDLS